MSFDIQNLNYWYDKYPKDTAQFLIVNLEYKEIRSVDELYKQFTFIMDKNNKVLAYADTKIDGVMDYHNLADIWKTEELNEYQQQLVKMALGHIALQKIYGGFIKREGKEYWINLPDSDGDEEVLTKIITRPEIIHLENDYTEFHYIFKGETADNIYRSPLDGKLYLENFEISDPNELEFLENFLAQNEIYWPKYNAESFLNVEYLVVVDLWLNDVNFFSDKMPNIDMAWGPDLDTLKIIGYYPEDYGYGIVLTLDENQEVDITLFKDYLKKKIKAFKFIHLGSSDLHAIEDALVLEYDLYIETDGSKLIFKREDLLDKIPFGVVSYIYVYIPDNGKVYNITDFEFKDWLKTHEEVKYLYGIKGLEFTIMG